MKQFINSFRKQFLFSIFLLLIIGGATPLDAANTPQDLYTQAVNCHKAVKDSPIGKSQRSSWDPCIQKAKSIYEMNPKGGWAAAGLFLTGSYYEDTFTFFKQTSDLENAKIAYERLVREHPSSAYTQQAKESLKKLSSITIPSTPSSPKPSNQQQLISVRFSDTDEKTRIVFDLIKEPVYFYRYIKGSSGSTAKSTIIIELSKTFLSDSANRYLSLRNQHVDDIRIAYGEEGKVLITVVLPKRANINFLTLENPYRLVLDITPDLSAPYSSTPVRTTKPGEKARRIVLDPGHGGKDPGALGAIHGVYEKDIVLSISRRLAERIRNELGWEVILTRSTDVFITLQERTETANNKKADLFISLHTNSASSKTASGIETYYLNTTKDQDAIRVAAIENATSQEAVSDLQLILNDLMRTAKVTESSRLASMIQGSLISNLSQKYDRIISRGVKQAPFYVLVGAHMPAVLLELSFISNLEECQRLITAEYQETICDALIEALSKYEKEMGPIRPN